MQVTKAHAAFRSSGTRRRCCVSVVALTGRSNGQPSKVGFIGLGKMGSNMLHNLIKAGHSVVVYDNNKVAMDRALGMGEQVEAAASPADVAAKEGVDLLFTMLPHPETVEQVYMGKGGLLAVQGGPMASLMVDCSTVDPPLARKIAAAAARVQLNPNRHPLPGLDREECPVLIDAPVSGGVVGAEKGTLSFMVGGDVQALELVKPYLMDMGHAVTHCGGHGNGQAARLCNTLVVAATMAATSECLALARRLGVDPQVMTEVLNSSSGRSWTSEVYNPVPGICPGTPPSNQYNGGLTSNTVMEQLDMLITAGEHAHSPVPLARYLTKELYKTVQAEGMGDKDFSAIYRYYYGSGAASEQWRSGDKLFSSMPM